MSQRVLTYYVCRHPPGGNPDEEDEIAYEVWLVLDVCLGEDGASAVPKPVLDLGRGADAAENLRQRLSEAGTGMVIWKSAGDLAGEEVARLIADLPGIMNALAGKPAGVPASAAVFGAAVPATLLFPLLEPVEPAVQALEVIGFVIGLVTGPHTLAIACAQHLIRGGTCAAMAGAFSQLGQLADPDALGDTKTSGNFCVSVSGNPRQGGTPGTRPVLGSVGGAVGRGASEIPAGGGHPLSAAGVKRLQEKSDLLSAGTPNAGENESPSTVRTIQDGGLSSAT